MFNTMLPDDIAVVFADDSMWETPLSPEEEACISKAVSKRQREFRAGRNAAKQALQNLGCTHYTPILSAENRRPLWPAGYLGSITHTKGFCAAALARESDYLGIGIDVEPNTPLKPDTLAYICTPTEQHWITQQAGSSNLQLGKIFFCIKETIYKVFNPIHHQFLGFNEADVTLSLQDSTFSAKVWQKKHDIQCHYSGCFAVDEQFIYASLVLNRQHG